MSADDADPEYAPIKNLSAPIRVPAPPLILITWAVIILPV